jgi:hypothetical protein
MPEEIRKNLYRVPVPLPGNPLKELNSYVIKGSDRTLVVDTAFARNPAAGLCFPGCGSWASIRRRPTYC